MRKLSIVLLILSFCSVLRGQATREDWYALTTGQASQSQYNLPTVLAIPGATVNICDYPANAVPCTNYGVTYTDVSGTTTCSAPTQLTRPDSNVCVGTTDSQGNFGAWLASGHYQYTLTTTYGSFGPYDFTVASAGGSSLFPSNTTIFFYGDSRDTVTSTCGSNGTVPSLAVTSVVASGGTLTISNVAPPATSSDITLYDFQNGDSVLNGVSGVVATSGGSSFTITGTSVPNGTYGAGQWGCTRLPSTQLAVNPKLPKTDHVYLSAVSNAGIAALAAAYAAQVQPYDPVTTGIPGIIVFQGGVTDAAAGTDAPTIETALQNFWATLHSRGWQIYNETIIPKDGNAGVTTSITVSNAVNLWMYGQTIQTAQLSSKKYIDAIVDVASRLPNTQDANLFIPSGPTAEHLTDAGNNAKFSVDFGSLQDQVSQPMPVNYCTSYLDCPALDAANFFSQPQRVAETNNGIGQGDWANEISIGQSNNAIGGAAIFLSGHQGTAANYPALYFNVTGGNPFAARKLAFYFRNGALGIQWDETHPSNISECWSKGDYDTSPEACISVSKFNLTRLAVSLPGDEGNPSADLELNNLYVNSCTGCGGGGSYPAAETHSATSSSSLNFTTCITSSNTNYQINITNIVLSASNVALYIQYSTNGGSTWDTASNYDFNKHFIQFGGAGGDSGGSTTSGNDISGGGTGSMVTALPNPFSAHFTLLAPLSTTAWKYMDGTIFAKYGSNVFSASIFFQYENVNAINALRLIPASGNITSGTMSCQPLPQ